MVSAGPGPIDTITRGNSAVNTAAANATIPSAVSPNARPTRPAAVADAVGWCERAAVAASSRLGHAEAATHLAAALTLPGSEAGEGRRLLGELAEAQDRAGDTAAARASFRRLAAAAAAAGDTAGLVRAALGVHRLGSRTAAEFAESLGLLAEAEAANAAGGAGSEPAALLRELAEAGSSFKEWQRGRATPG